QGDGRLQAQREVHARQPCAAARRGRAVPVRAAPRRAAAGELHHAARRRDAPEALGGREAAGRRVRLRRAQRPRGAQLRDQPSRPGIALIRIAAETPWYDLFSRGARDWLRHNQKVREAVKETLPALLAGADLMSQPGNRTVLVPVKILEHARLRLLEPEVRQGAGQGRGEPGEVLQPGREEGERAAQPGGTQAGERRFVVDAVIFALDVSGSMDEAQRRLAKTFFFFALQGIRRQYARVETVFLAHAAQAWEFEESQFFQAASSGGTLASSAFRLALEVMQARYDAQRYNVYFFYASDGENAAEDREGAASLLADLTGQTNYAGYVETGGGAAYRPRETQLAEIFGEMKAKGRPVGASRLGSQDDVWRAIGELFREQAKTD